MGEAVKAKDAELPEDYYVSEVVTIAEAKRVSEFLLSLESFDTKLTPGEMEQAGIHPLMSLGEKKSRYWYVENLRGEIIAVNGVKEDEHKNGGYVGAFLAVNGKYRRHGIAARLFDIMLDFIRSNNGRYLLIDTSDQDEYKTIRSFLEKQGFSRVGYFPHHYYDGEGTYWYYKRMDDKDI